MAVGALLDGALGTPLLELGTKVLCLAVDGHSVVLDRDASGAVGDFLVCDMDKQRESPWKR